MFAVNRFEMNKGTGIESGKWVFDPFMFSDSVFGRATVEYDVSVPRRGTEYKDRNGRSVPCITLSEVVIDHPRITELVVVDDDGKDLDMQLPDGVLHDLSMTVFTAFREQREAVSDFEMGLL